MTPSRSRTSVRRPGLHTTGRRARIPDAARGRARARSRQRRSVWTAVTRGFDGRGDRRSTRRDRSFRGHDRGRERAAAIGPRNPIEKISRRRSAATHIRRLADRRAILPGKTRSVGARATATPATTGRTGDERRRLRRADGRPGGRTGDPAAGCARAANGPGGRCSWRLGRIGEGRGALRIGRRCSGKMSRETACTSAAVIDLPARRRIKGAAAIVGRSDVRAARA